MIPSRTLAVSVVAVAVAAASAACAPVGPTQPSFFASQGGAPPPTDPNAAAAPADPSAPADPADPYVEPAGAGPVTPTPGPTAAAPPALAGSLRITAPPEFRQDGTWYVATAQQTQWNGNVRTEGTYVRFPPAVPAQGDFGQALRAAWQQHTPAELAGTVSGLAFRRYVGDGLVAQFVHGRGTEKGHKYDSWFSLYLVDCGATWQPVVIASTYAESEGSAGDLIEVEQALPRALGRGEGFLAGLRCAGPTYPPIVDPPALAGHYHYGSGAFQQYVHIYTGSTSTHSVSYGGEYDLRADGTFAYRHSSATNLGAGTAFQGEEDTGRWVVERDLLVLTFTKLKRTKRLRIAGVNHFPDSRVAVLVDESKAINPTSVGHGSEVFTTKPAQ